MEASACIKYDVEPPRILVYARRWFEDKCPPYSGGWLEWPVNLYDNMEQAYIAWRTISNYYRLRSMPEFRKKYSEQEVNLVLKLLKLLRESESRGEITLKNLRENGKNNV